jgi:hypothetical protein
MKTMNPNVAQRPGTIDVQAEATDAAEGMHAPRNLTLRENVILTIKVFAFGGVLGGIIWGVKLWTSAR